MNTKDIGESSEAQILAALLKNGKVVLKPFGDNQRYDLVVDDHGRFVRIQCKTGRLKGGAIIADATSSYAHRGRGKKGYKGEADVLGVYCPETDSVYLIPIDEAKTAVCLRVEEAKNKQKKNIVWAEDYKFQGHIP
jgi:hypothetical protein